MLNIALIVDEFCGFMRVKRRRETGARLKVSKRVMSVLIVVKQSELVAACVSERSHLAGWLAQHSIAQCCAMVTSVELAR